LTENVICFELKLLMKSTYKLSNKDTNVKCFERQFSPITWKGVAVAKN